MSGDPDYAPAPFNHEKADVILRSSDNVDFRVFKLFLSLASPVFETLFGIPQPVGGGEDQETQDGLAVISLTEDSKTLDALLRFCYPCTLADDPKLEVLQDALDILNAAKKYSLDAIEKKARQAIADPKILEAISWNHPGMSGCVNVYFAASKVSSRNSPRRAIAKHRRGSALPAHLPPEMW